MSYTLRPVRVTALVPAPAEEVFAYVADTRNDPEWCRNISDVEQLAGNGVEVGSRYRFHQVVEVQGRQLESDVEVEVLSIGDGVIEWDVNDRFQSRHVRLSVEPADGGSNVVQETTATFKRKPGLARWVYPRLARRTFRRQFEDLAARFATTR